MMIRSINKYDLAAWSTFYYIYLLKYNTAYEKLKIIDNLWKTEKDRYPSRTKTDKNRDSINLKKKIMGKIIAIM